MKRVLLDISGFPHYVWVPLLKILKELKIPLRVIYAEPDKYKIHVSPTSKVSFDLSERFEVKPLPGLARLDDPDESLRRIFVPSLGFEGSRPERLLLTLDPQPDVVPIVGIPGFQISYPTYTFSCNRDFLQQYGSASEIRYARASCPFEAYEAVDRLSRSFGDNSFLYLAPVGTKPHSLGLVWYAINNPNTTELLYDNPVRKPGRTKGVGTIHIYDFENFNVG